VRLRPGDIAGESAYNDELPSLVDELDAAGLLQDSDGAKCVFPPGFTGRDGQPLPILVRRSGGGFGYGATDLAALRHRLRDVRADRILYVIGAPQQQYLAMVFAVARLAGWLGEDSVVEHVSFGSVLGSDGKMLRSRAGVTVKLADLLDEAVTRAAAVVAAKSPDLSPAEAASVARAVGIGAVKYADLKTDRESDYVFGWNRMLALDGNTAPYLQYAHARIRSILRRADESPGAQVVSGSRLNVPWRWSWPDSIGPYAVPRRRYGRTSWRASCSASPRYSVVSMRAAPWFWPRNRRYGPAGSRCAR
jgi:arginyl-tRNA synthetase